MPPTERVLVAIRSVDGKRTPKMMRWGLLPHWAKDEKISFSTFNARAEEFTTKPAFRDPWDRGQRCLVVTDGFTNGRSSTPRARKNNPTPSRWPTCADGMAGLWARWNSPSGEEIQSCTILTCGTNSVMGELHNRMPVIVAESDWSKWLGEEPATEEELLAMLKPCPDEALKIWPVDKRVGNVRNKGPQLATPV